MALTLDQIKAVGIPKNVSKLYNKRYTPAAIPNDSVNLYDAIKLAFTNLETPTNLSNTPASSTVTVESSTGTNTILPAATSSLAGVMTASDKTNLTSLITLTGVAAGSNDLGTFTGTTISDNGTLKSVLQELETALEANGDGIYGGSGNVSSPTTVILESNLDIQGNNGSSFEVNCYAPGLFPDSFSYLLNYQDGVYIGCSFNGGDTSLYCNTNNLEIRNDGTTNAIMKYSPLDYFADYSADYTTRSLVDKAYVDSSLAGAADGNGIYDGSGTVPNGTNASLASGANMQIRYSNTTPAIFISDGFGYIDITNGSNTGSVQVQGSNTSINFNNQTIGLSTSNGITITDDLNSKGAVYNADYSSNYTNRSLVDKEYVDGVGIGSLDGATVDISTGGLTFDAGTTGTNPFQVTFGTTTGSVLYADNANAILQYFDAGGTNKVHCKSDGILLQTTSPDQVTITGKAAEYSADYSGGYTDRSLVDKAYVDGKIIAYTPTSSADGAGSTGDVAYDDNYIYVKTSGNGWCRAAISTF